MIEKKIHYCWFGNNKKSDLILRCMKSWKEYCPDCEIIEWNENNFDINSNTYVKEAYNSKRWAFVSDYVRLWAVYHYGGIYLDTDVELIKNIDFIFSNNCFFCKENDELFNTGLGFGAVAYNPIIKALLDDYENIHFKLKNGKFDLTPCPQRNSSIIYSFDTSKYISYSKEYFCPLNYDTKELTITDETVAIHWFGESWLTKRDKIKFKTYAIIKKFLHMK